MSASNTKPVKPFILPKKVSTSVAEYHGIVPQPEKPYEKIVWAPKANCDLRGNGESLTKPFMTLPKKGSFVTNIRPKGDIELA